MTDKLPAGMPHRLGPYKLLHLLGRGGMSQVFLALRYGASGFEKKVALKTLPLERTDDERLTKALIEEARICATLQHRNLVQVHDLGVDQGIYYLCMEVVEGINLSKLSKQKALSVPLALYLASEIAIALDYVHHAPDEDGRLLGLIHRDVSPSNVLISHAGEIKLADFGIAKATLLTDATWGRFRKGTIAYMSPEQVAGEALSPQSDQFSLGIILMELLAGRRPFDAETPVETMDRIKEAEPPDLSDIPASLHQLLLTMLKRKPSDRFPTTRELFRQIEIGRSHHPTATIFSMQQLMQTSDAKVTTSAPATQETTAHTEEATREHEVRK